MHLLQRAPDPSMKSLLVCMAAHNWELRRWIDFRKCQTATATPAEPGGLSLTLGAAAFSDRHDRQPIDACLHRHARAHDCLHHGRPGKMPATRQSAARKNIAASESRSVSCPLEATEVRGRPRQK